MSNLRLFSCIFLLCLAVCATAQPFDSRCFNFFGATPYDMAEFKAWNYHRLVIVAAEHSLTDDTVIYDTAYVGIWDTLFRKTYEKGQNLEVKYAYHVNGKLKKSLKKDTLIRPRNLTRTVTASMKTVKIISMKKAGFRSLPM